MSNSTGIAMFRVGIVAMMVSKMSINYFDQYWCDKMGICCQLCGEIIY
jgi:hypothetical protein